MPITSKGPREHGCWWDFNAPEIGNTVSVSALVGAAATDRSEDGGEIRF